MARGREAICDERVVVVAARGKQPGVLLLLLLLLLLLVVGVELASVALALASRARRGFEMAPRLAQRMLLMLLEQLVVGGAPRLLLEQGIIR